MITALLFLSAFPVNDAEPTRADTSSLTMGNVTQVGGSNSTTYNFTAFYMDINNTAPNYMLVEIDGWYYNMTVVPGFPLDYTRGVQFMYTITLSAGSHSYRFLAKNQTTEMRIPATGTSTLNTRNSGPVLSNYTYTPSSPTDSEGVYFFVTYSDPNGYSERYVMLYIWESGDKINTTSVNMSVQSGNYTSGVICWAALNLTAGFYNYYFEAVNINRENVSLPSDGMYNLTVRGTSQPNNPPALYGGSHSPLNPTEQDLITFSVGYYDQDNDPPTGADLVLFKDNSTYPVTYNLASNGNTYNIGVTLSVNVYLKTGSYLYYFQVTSWNASSRGYDYIRTVNSTVNVSAASVPYMTGLQVSPATPVANSAINVTVTYKDPLGGSQIPDVKMHIHQTDGPSSVVYDYNMTRTGSNFTAGVTYYTNLILGAGNYSYYLSYRVYNGSFRYPVTNQTIYVSPPAVDNAPVLSRGGVTGNAGNYTFSVTYLDSDNDAPTYIRLNIGPASWNGSAVAQYFSVYNMSSRGSTYNRGITATYTLSLTNGSYRYYFDTFSRGTNGNGSATYPVGSYLYLNVSITPPTNSAPVLYSPSVSPASPISGNGVSFSIYYKDIDNDAPSNVTLYLGSTRYAMTGSSTTYTRGVVYSSGMTLTTGNYSYYFWAISGNHSARYPARGSLSLSVVSGNNGGINNETGNNSAALVIDPASGEMDLEIVEIEEGVYLQFDGFEDGVVKLTMNSDEVKDRVIKLDLDEDIIGDDFTILLDGKKVKVGEIDDVDSMEGDQPLYALVVEDGTVTMHLYIPDASSHSIEAFNEENDRSDFPWIPVILIGAAAVILLIVAISVLTSAQVKKKQESFYSDFDLETSLDEDELLVSGKLDEEESSWDDLLE